MRVRRLEQSKFVIFRDHLLGPRHHLNKFETVQERKSSRSRPEKRALLMSIGL